MTIRVLVFSSAQAQREGRSMLERILDWDNSLRFDFMGTATTLKTLFGSGAKIVMEVD